MWPFNRSKVEVVIYIYQSEYDSIIEEAKHFPQIETGGDLFGTFTHGNMPVVWWASGPGPRANRQSLEFSQDVEFTTYWQKLLMENFGIQYIGTWHSHHQIGLKKPSRGDMQAAQAYARRHGREKTVEIIVTHENTKTLLYPYFYPNATMAEYISVNFKLLSGESPIRHKLHLLQKTNPDFLEQRREQEPETHSQEKYVGGIPQIDSYILPIEIPKPLRLELEKLGVKGVSVDRKSENMFMIVIPFNEYQSLAAVVKIEDKNKGYLNFLRVDFVDRYYKTNQDITHILREQGIISTDSQPNHHKLKDIFLYIKQE